MSATIQAEPQEVNLQERPIEALTDESLPAAQVIQAQSQNAEEIPAPRFIP